MDVLRKLGIEPAGGIPLGSGSFAIHRNRKHTLPSGILSLLTTSLFTPAEKIEAGKLLASLPKIDSDRINGITLREWAEDSVSHQKVREFILAVCRLATYVTAPDRISAGAALSQVQKALKHGVLYLDHGWQTLVDALRQKAEEAGVIVKTGARATCVERNRDGEVEGVLLSNGESYRSRTVIVAASPGVAAELVAGGRESSLGEWANRATPVKAAILDIAVSHLPEPRATFALGIDAPLYFSVHSAVARLAPAGGALIHAARYLPPGLPAPGPASEAELESLVDQVQPGWREFLVHRRFLPDMTVLNSMPVASEGGTAGRPGPEVKEIPGLFVAGDWVGKEGMLAHASLASGETAAGMASEHSARIKNSAAVCA
jgi:phytoene dehydrogenase-like protein